MLSPEEKREMLEDAASIQRRIDFEQGHIKKVIKMSIDEYLRFLDNVQKVFGPFNISRELTVVKYNKL